MVLVCFSPSLQLTPLGTCSAPGLNRHAIGLSPRRKALPYDSAAVCMRQLFSFIKMHLRPSPAIICPLSLLSLGARAGTHVSVAVMVTRAARTQGHPVAVYIVLLATWLAISGSSSLVSANTFSDSFCCPIDGQISKCVPSWLRGTRLFSRPCPCCCFPFRLALMPSSDWSDAALRAASSPEQAPPVGMSNAADGTVQLLQSVSPAAGSFWHVPAHASLRITSRPLVMQPTAPSITSVKIQPNRCCST